MSAPYAYVMCMQVKGLKEEAQKERELREEALRRIESLRHESERFLESLRHDRERFLESIRHERELRAEAVKAAGAAADRRVLDLRFGEEYKILRAELEKLKQRIEEEDEE